MQDDCRHSIETELVHGATPFDPVTGAISAPIYQSSTFRHPALYESTGFDYSRGLNPTRLELEKTVALLERGAHALAFSSGMAAVSCFLKLFVPGDRVIVSEDLYGGTFRLFEGYYARYGIEFAWVDTSDLDAVERALAPATRAVFVETPSNPMMRVTDIAGIDRLLQAAAINGAKPLLVVDNTFLSPYYQNPIALGADVVVHSGTKYLGGHNDTLSGFLVLANDSLVEPLRVAQMSEGAALGPFDAWLILRGLKTLAVRMDRQSANALRIAQWLRTHPKVERVFYVGFPDHPQYALSTAQSRGFGSMISFYLKDAKDVTPLLSRVTVILFAESLGGVETLVTYPIEQTHKAIPEALRRRSGVNDRLIRLSVGIENVEDLIKDLDRSLS